MTMINWTNIAAGLALSLVVTGTSIPAFAAQPTVHPGHAARAQATESQDEGGPVSPAREKALRECSTATGGMKQYAMGVQESAGLRACMNQHGQPE
jgi:hypothetical protein